MIHCRLSVEKCNADCAEGSAMFTIVASSTTISWATPSRASTAHRLGSAIEARVGMLTLIGVLPVAVIDHHSRTIRATSMTYKTRTINSAPKMPDTALHSL